MNSRRSPVCLPVQCHPQSTNPPLAQGRLTTDSGRLESSVVRPAPTPAVLGISLPNLIGACGQRVNPQKAPRETGLRDPHLPGTDKGYAFSPLMSGEILVAVSRLG